MVYTVTCNPALDYVMWADDVAPGRINRAEKTALTYGRAFYITQETDLNQAAIELKKELDRVTDQSEMFINKKHFDNQRG